MARDTLTPDMFSSPPRYPDGPGYSNQTTSKIAAAMIAPHVSKLAAVVLEHIRANPSTAWEIEKATKMRAQTISARIRELTLKGLVEASKERRDTRAGRPAIVWRPAAAEPKLQRASRAELVNLLKRVKPLVTLYGAPPMKEDFARVLDAE